MPPRRRRGGAPILQSQPSLYRFNLKQLFSLPYRLCNPPPAVGKVRSFSLTPVFKVRLEDVLDRKHLPPLGLKDFEEWLLFVEQAPENLYFVLWLRDYTHRYKLWADSVRAKQGRIRAQVKQREDQLGEKRAAYRLAWPAHEFSPSLADSYKRACQTFFAPSSPYELSVPPELLSPFINQNIGDVNNTASVPAAQDDPHVHPDPAVFAPLLAICETRLRASLARCVRAAFTNVGTFRATCGLIAGTTLLLISLAPILSNFIQHKPREARVAAFPFLWIGLGIILASLKGVCVAVYIFGDFRQLRRFELERPPPPPLPTSSTSSLSSKQQLALSYNEDEKKASPGALSLIVPTPPSQAHYLSPSSPSGTKRTSRTILQPLQPLTAPPRIPYPYSYTLNQHAPHNRTPTSFDPSPSASASAAASIMSTDHERATSFYAYSTSSYYPPSTITLDRASRADTALTSEDGRLKDTSSIHSSSSLEDSDPEDPNEIYISPQIPAPSELSALSRTHDHDPTAVLSSLLAAARLAGVDIHEVFGRNANMFNIASGHGVGEGRVDGKGEGDMSGEELLEMYYQGILLAASGGGQGSYAATQAIQAITDSGILSALGTAVIPPPSGATTEHGLSSPISPSTSVVSASAATNGIVPTTTTPISPPPAGPVVLSLAIDDTASSDETKAKLVKAQHQTAGFIPPYPYPPGNRPYTATSTSTCSSGLTKEKTFPSALVSNPSSKKQHSNSKAKARARAKRNEQSDCEEKSVFSDDDEDYQRRRNGNAHVGRRRAIQESGKRKCVDQDQDDEAHECAPPCWSTKLKSKGGSHSRRRAFSNGGGASGRYHGYKEQPHPTAGDLEKGLGLYGSGRNPDDVYDTDGEYRNDVDIMVQNTSNTSAVNGIFGLGIGHGSPHSHTRKQGERPYDSDGEYDVEEGRWKVRGRGRRSTRRCLKHDNNLNNIDVDQSNSKTKHIDELLPTPPPLGPFDFDALPRDVLIKTRRRRGSSLNHRRTQSTNTSYGFDRAYSTSDGSASRSRSSGRHHHQHHHLQRNSYERDAQAHLPTLPYNSSPTTTAVNGDESTRGDNDGPLDRLYAFFFSASASSSSNNNNNNKESTTPSSAKSSKKSTRRKVRDEEAGVGLDVPNDSSENGHGSVDGNSNALTVPQSARSSMFAPSSPLVVVGGDGDGGEATPGRDDQYRKNENRNTKNPIMDPQQSHPHPQTTSRLSISPTSLPSAHSPTTTLHHAPSPTVFHTPTPSEENDHHRLQIGGDPELDQENHDQDKEWSAQDWKTRYASVQRTPPFGPVTRVLSPVARRAHWEVVVRAFALSFVLSVGIIGALVAVPVPS